MRAVLHSDLDNCYAAIECLRRPELRGKPVAVAGDPERRHGIILAKSMEAKTCGVRTGEALWQARQKCPELIAVPPDFPLYLQYCRMVRELYYEYTDLVEPFGLDEAWLDVTGSVGIFGSGENIAHDICRRIKEEIGLTVSVGVSWNKVFAKLGSDMNKPDAVTVITPENFRKSIWPLPARQLLYVGPATEAKLRRYGIENIRGIAEASPEFLEKILGKAGGMLRAFARGEENSRVLAMGEEHVVRSVGNSTTTPRALESDQDAVIVFHVLCESVARRLRECGLLCRTVQIQVRDEALAVFERQTLLPRPGDLEGDLYTAAIGLLRANYDWQMPLRSVGVRACDLIPSGACIQTSVFENEVRRVRRERLERTTDELRARFGPRAPVRAVTRLDGTLYGLEPREEHMSIFSSNPVRA